MRYTITITRQFGSYGRQIGQMIAETLGIKYYDSTILTKEWIRENLPQSLLDANKKMRKKEALTTLEKLMSTSALNRWDENENRFQELSNTISYLGKEESAVFVGRMSDYILDDIGNVVRIFIYAPFEKRVKKVQLDTSCSKDEARRMVVETDYNRDYEHKQHAGYLPYDINHQEILIDSSLLGPEKTAEVLIDIIKKKFDL